VSIRDAVAAVTVPVIEVHISNIFARDGFRHHSHIAPVARASLCGFGITGYALAIDGLAALIGAAQQG
jgi:3-dehydroquinate dehydratase-2